MAAFYAIYYGPEGLKLKARHAHHYALILSEGSLNFSKNSNRCIYKKKIDKLFKGLKIRITLFKTRCFSIQSK
jgi:glycine cleavage system pyridoxal-binding protein P